MDAQLDHEEHELDQWSHLKEAFTLPALSLASIRKIPVLGRYFSASNYCTHMEQGVACL